MSAPASNHPEPVPAPEAEPGRPSSATALPGSPPAPPTVSLPKGGGAMRGLGEVFSTNSATGTAALTVPIPTSPGRGGFGPALNLSYDSGAGNGPFGLGWQLDAPSISRKTDRGLPRYLDDPDQDTFVLSGMQELVPEREPDESGQELRQHGERREVGGRRYLVQRYRPRVEGAFHRIERWRDVESASTHWQVSTADNVTSSYGLDEDSRIADPARPGQVFRWLLTETFDGYGNTTRYRYLPEDLRGVELAAPHEQHRVGSQPAGRYLKRIDYGNLEPRGSAEQPSWLFSVVFDYGDHGDPANPEPDRDWPCRPDPFSTYRPGFEVRSYRRCHRILMFHHFPDEPSAGANCLVRSTELAYRDTGTGAMTSIRSITQHGYLRGPDGSYQQQSLPPLELEYSTATVADHQHPLSAGELANAPTGLAGSQWVDLDGEGLSGLLDRDATSWRYKANLGGARFGPSTVLATRPAADQPARQALLDLDGDGRVELTDLHQPDPGCYPRSRPEPAGSSAEPGNRPLGWEPFRPFRQLPNIDFGDPNLRFVDLDGDGLADLLLTGDDQVYTWYPSLGHDGFGSPRRTVPDWAAGAGPRLVAADAEQSVYLADMSGDGLSDLVRVRNTEVRYWPNLGYGRFGAGITLDRSPCLDQPDQFDQRRVRLADVDGSGTADLVYLHRDGARLYFNQSGNALSEPYLLGPRFPKLSSDSVISIVDLLGNGTGCLVWSSPQAGDANRPVRYLELMVGGRKPHLLTRTVNNLGAETLIDYAPSTRFYLQDKQAGQPWQTRLPFPVQVVASVRTIDHVNHNEFVSSYAYHDGCYLGWPDREYLGFGLVEQVDTAIFGGLQSRIGHPRRAGDVPPVLTRTWFQAGPGSERRAREQAWSDGEPGLPVSVLPNSITPVTGPERAWRLSATDRREAERALKGNVLRREVYGCDGSEAAGRPYQVSEHNYTVAMVQPALEPRPDGPANYHGVFLVTPRETLSADYERVLYEVAGEQLPDPRRSHQLVLATDRYGHPLRAVTVNYGRRHADPALTAAERQRQGRSWLTCAESDYTNAVDSAAGYRVPVSSEQRSYELRGLIVPPSGRFGWAELTRAVAELDREIPYEQWQDDGLPGRRLIERGQVRYRCDDLSGELPAGELPVLALPYRSLRQAFTDGLVTELFHGEVADAELTEAGYLRQDGAWWIPSGRVFYSEAERSPEQELAAARGGFFLVRRSEDPFGAASRISYDRYQLLVHEVSDALGNLSTVGERDADGRTVRSGQNYRVLQPQLVSDANRNRSAVAFDTLGRVAGTAELGKAGAGEGDTLAGFDPDPAPDEVAAFFADPWPAARRLLSGATTRLLYDLAAFSRDGRPAVVATLSRETHVSELETGTSSPIQRAFNYSDGFGRVVQATGQAAPHADAPSRWITSGWQIFNNKGKPIRQYEPFFSDTHQFRFAITAGVSPLLCYDPLDRLVATLNPDDSYRKVVFDPWRQQGWDANDTVLLDPRTDPDVADQLADYLAGVPGWRTWFAQREQGELGRGQQRAAVKAAAHAGTPSTSYVDGAGHSFLAVQINRAPGMSTDQRYRTLTEQDIEGNVRSITDPLGRTVVRQGFSMLGNQLARDSMDSGAGMLLTDIGGQPVRSWNSRGFRFRTGYDLLRRPTSSWVAGPGLAGELLHRRTEYGEQQPTAVERNLRARVARTYDGVGVSSNELYDFKANLIATERRLAAEATKLLDWAAEVPLEPDGYRGTSSFDALNRPVTMTTPDGTITVSRYDESGALAGLSTRLRGAEPRTAIVDRVERNVRGQRTEVSFSNGSHTSYRYDPATFRLVELRTTRGRRVLQQLEYVYDPVGNPVRVLDHAQQTLFFGNRLVRPTASYTYDATYRLVRASGREHLGQHEATPLPPDSRDRDRIGLIQPGDGRAMARYVERYDYDPAGNLIRVRHRSAGPAGGGWTRAYHYRQPSALEPNQVCNRLSNTSVPGSAHRPERLRYDEQGNLTALPEMPMLNWDPEDRLHASSRQVTGAGQPERTYYGYDAAGQRVRKRTVLATAAGAPDRVASERIYLGAFEIFREFDRDGAVSLQRESVHVLDDQHRVALVETRIVGDDDGAEQLLRYQLTDHLQSAVLELDERAHIISYEQYYPYGSTSYQAVRSATETPKRYRFSGRERDTETGLAYHGARYYLPWLGRWASCDPAGLVDGLNVYAYSRGNPIRLTDPNGHQSAPPTLMGIWQYGVRLANRAGLGRNVQVDHPIQVAARVAQRSSPGGTSYYSRAISKAAGEEGVLVETGRGLFHTELGKLQKLITQRVKSGALASESELVHETQEAYRAAGRITNTVVNESALGRAILSNQRAIQRTTAQTLQELRSLPAGPTTLGSSGGIAAEVERSFAATFSAAEHTASSVAQAAPTVAEAVDAAATISRSAGRLARVVEAVAPVARALAPVGRVIGRVAAPLAVAAVAVEVATAHTTGQQVHAGVDAVATAVSFAGVPGMVAGAGIAASAFVGEHTAAAVTEATGSRAAGVASGTLAAAATGAAAGAIVGSIVPGVGTAIGAIGGAVIGGAIGFVSSYWN